MGKYQAGQIISGSEINRIGRHIYAACPNCGKLRFIPLRYDGRLCGSCATKKSHKDNPSIPRKENHYNWKGGININKQGYVVEYVNKNNPFYLMATNTEGKRYGGYILQHRYIMAKHLGRCLESWEIIHHINGDRTDNRIENLKLTIRANHSLSYGNAYSEGYLEGYNKALQECKQGVG